MRTYLRRWLRLAGGIALCGLLVLAAFAACRRYHFRRAPAALLAREQFYADLARDEPTAANYRLLAETAVAATDYPEAQDAYRKAAGVYRDKNLPSEGYAMDRLAERYEVQAEPFYQIPTEKAEVETLDTHARLEPVYGCYTGAFIDHEDSIHGTYRDEYGAWRRDVSAFNHLTGIHHAVFFMYLGYGRHFPTKFVRHMNDNGAAAQIALEPSKLDDVRDDAYLHRFAAEARKSRTPIFLRFASEMNGDWVPYHGDPRRYIEKFRLVARVMHAEAPNVAMVWCPFETPVREIAPYFPGGDAVDWVGLNVYSVPFWDNDPKRPGDWRNPADSLRYVYGLYAARRPIMICEYGASHRSSLDGVDRTDLARTKMGELYASLPRLYPRVKAVCWLSMNAIKHAIPGRQSNDYSLLGDDLVRKRYHELLNDPYFLASVSRDTPRVARYETKPLPGGAILRGRVPFSAWVKLYDDHPTVVWRLDGVEQLKTDLPGPYRWVLDTRRTHSGPAAVEMVVLDSQGHEVARRTRHVILKS